MGTILYTRDGEGLYDHEGYVSHILDDGTSALGTWTTEIERRTVGWRAECTCGWLGAIRGSGGPKSPSDSEYDAVLNEWELAHAAPLVRTAERVWQLRSLADTVRIAEVRLRDGIQEAVKRGATWSEIAAATRTNLDTVQRLSRIQAEPAAEPTSQITAGVWLCDGPIAI